MNKNKKALLIGFVSGILLAVLFIAAVIFVRYCFSYNNQTDQETQQKFVNGETEIQKSIQIEEENNIQSDILGDTEIKNIQVPDMDVNSFIAFQNLEKYTYIDLENDTERLLQAYPGLITMDTLGTTADGRSIYHFIIGNPQAEKKVFINAGIHGREYMTCQLVMKQMVSYLQNIKEENMYDGISYSSMWQKCAVHVVPMINPDGVTISQYGLSGILTSEVRGNVEEIAIREGGIENSYYYTRWKANGNGVDINRNFDALWEQYDDGVGQPSADHYKGTAPGCEVEAASLIRLTEQEQFQATISYHTQGSVIYWYFAQEGTLYEDTKSLAEVISNVTGYPTDANYEYLDPAGYKDWGISKKGIPGLTIEVGTETSPVPPVQFDAVWSQNQYVWETLICWTLNHQ